ncbi:MAG TPA: phosphatidate cytidylyltransferase [Candidatus Acidoferrales bacterium]|nr:phosphatidate cytidylyltransferase [Candidatus Acidoferrales bacterium]
MLLRILTALVLIPIVVALVWWGLPSLIAGLAGIVAILAIIELFDLANRVGLRAYQKWTIVCVAGLFYAQYSQGFVETPAVVEGFSLVRNAAGGVFSIEALLLVFVFGCVSIGLFTRRPLHEVLPSVSVSAAGLLFIALPFSYLVRLNNIERTGRQLVLFTLCLVWAGDMLAYFVGRGFGRVPMAPALSPKKTWEGALGNILGSLLVAVLFARWMQIDVVTLMFIAGVANIAGQMGDLIESAYKRGASVKDSGKLLPGHGGVLDRVDSLMLAAPVVWVMYQWIVSPH